MNHESRHANQYNMAWYGTLVVFIAHGMSLLYYNDIHDDNKYQSNYIHVVLSPRMEPGGGPTLLLDLDKRYIGLGIVNADQLSHVERSPRFHLFSVSMCLQHGLCLRPSVVFPSVLGVPVCLHLHNFLDQRDRSDVALAACP